MEKKKNIDRLFQEKFKDFDVKPNDALWDRISDRLPNKKKKRRVVPLWWQIGGVAAIIALLLTVGVNVFDSVDNSKQELPVVEIDQPKTDVERKQGSDPEGSEKNQVTEIPEKDQSTQIADSKIDSDQDSQLKNGANPTIKKNKNSESIKSSALSTRNAIVKHKEKESKSSTKSRAGIEELHNTNNAKLAEHQIEDHEKLLKQNVEDTQVKDAPQLKSAVDERLKHHADSKVAHHNSKDDIPKKDSSVLNSNEDRSDLNSADPSEKKSIEEAIAEHEDIINEEEDQLNRWSIAPNVAPVYYSSLGNGSSLSQQFNDNSKGGDINMSYGITSAYALSKKLKIRAGIHQVNLNQTTADVVAFAGPEIASRGVEAQQLQAGGNIKLKSNQNVMVMSSKMLGLSSAPETFNTAMVGEIDQRLGFIEVPLELEYRLVDKTFGVNVIGGFSTLFLNDNEIYADVGGTSTLIGEANNINSTSFSANFGLGFDYSLSKQWNINLEPQFKYQLNTFNNTTGDFRPFFIGVYTGLSFKF